MALMDQLVAKAKTNKQRIVLAEGTEPRTIQAADRILGDDVADIVLIGAKSEIDALVAEYGLKNIDKATIVEPLNNPKAQQYADLLFKLREKKGMTPELAKATLLSDYTYFANGSSYTVRVEGKKYIVTNDGSYILNNQSFDVGFGSSSKKAYSLLTKQKMVGVDGVNFGTISNMIDYLDKIDFEEWGNSPMDDNGATFVITDPAVVDSSSQLYIYDANRFSYKNVFYRVVSDQNFSSLFR